jgi:hypothetical protein
LFASIFTISAILIILKDMVLAPALALPLSYGLAALALGLLVVAGIDLAGIGLLPLIIRRNERQIQAEAERAKAEAERARAKAEAEHAKAEAEYAKRPPRHGPNWIKREAEKIGEPLPEPWPPEEPDLRAFEDRIHARRLELNEVWDRGSGNWRPIPVDTAVVEP